MFTTEIMIDFIKLIYLVANSVTNVVNYQQNYNEILNNKYEGD